MEAEAIRFRQKYEKTEQDTGKTKRRTKLRPVADVNGTQRKLTNDW